MGGKSSDEDSGDDGRGSASRSSDDESEPARKVARTGGGAFGGGGFSNDGGGGGGAAISADVELEAMLTASGGFASSAGGAGVPPGSAFGLGFPGSGLFAGAGGGGKGGGKGDRDPRIDRPPPPVMAFDGVSIEQKVQTTRMDFNRISSHDEATFVPVPKELVESLMTPEHRQLLIEESGAGVEWMLENKKIALTGSPEQVKRAQRLLARAMMHCHWGRSKDKIRRLLKPQKAESVLVRLSPMNTLRPVQKTLSAGQAVLCIGKDKANEVVIPDALMSRQHCVIELDPERGAVYALDTSTNGTFLNGKRLPSKTVGKVLLSHGDELLLKDPALGDQEFGYIVNLSELTVKTEAKLEAPRRMLTPEEMANPSDRRGGSGGGGAGGGAE